MGGGCEGDHYTSEPDAVEKEARDTGTEMARRKKTRLETCFDLGGTLTRPRRTVSLESRDATAMSAMSVVSLGPTRTGSHSRRIAKTEVESRGGGRCMDRWWVLRLKGVRRQGCFETGP